MEFLIGLLVFIAVTSYLAYARASLGLFTAAYTVLMIVGTAFSKVGFFSWLVFIAIAAVLNVTSLRRQLISNKLLEMFKKVMPEMSSTEKEALNAGTTWYEAELFKGEPNWDKLHTFPQPRLSQEEQAFLDGPVEEVCRMVDDWEVTHELADLPPHIWQYLKDHKFFAMIIKKQYGGLEFSAYAQSRVLQKLSGVSIVLASTVGVPNSLGPGELLQHYGTKEQQDYYLPRLATGEEIPCFALTSPEAGSDAGAIPDYGIVCKGTFNGEEVLGMRLTWNKRYITLAPVATILGLAFKLRDPDNLLGDEEDLGITCALIPTDIDGVITGRRHFPLNIPFQNGPTQGNDVFVPLDFIIGGAKMAGQGWRMLVECLSVGRAITLPSNAAGGVKQAAMASGAYSHIRRQFKLPIGKMEGIEEALARIGGNAYLMDAVTTMSTGAVDLGEKPSVISAICKYHLTEKMRDCISDAMDIHGGKGVCMGPSNYLARGYQGAPIAITVEGANILTRNMIIYGQGAIRCHPYVLAEMEAANNRDMVQGQQDFDQALFGHIGFTLSNLVRSKLFGFFGTRFVKAPFKDETRHYYRQMTKFSANLALLSDLSMALLGGDLKRRERISARLGDVLSYLYLASATLKRFHDEGRQVEDKPLMMWAVEDSLYKCEQALKDICENFPVPFVGKAFKLMVMPFGPSLTKPSDKLDHKVARILQVPSETRNRIGQGQYLDKTDGNVFGQLEVTLENIIQVEAIVDKINAATSQRHRIINLDQLAQMALEKGIISEQESELMILTEAQRKAVINVDDFDPFELVANKEKHLANNSADKDEQAA
ncbi:acyl-CoA dehydrogenase FadE [Thalassotalea ponticola]|uniref:acyl-CoA dehydrogenase FadE n=1 Tax=Thalassotalea ponticola TaxID=1523392 RepID=UPI0025B5A36A|nr:acyl-CoA dehydrogenase FadE [Thalassotalea ponticola]MDN3653016.1 acyl-CoA dehydrogenase FadE [Thalassotalea ponticola]